MNQIRDFCEKWITDVSPMAMEVLAENAEYASKCEVRFNGDMGFEIGDPPYSHVVNMKRKQCSCRSWQLKGISCAHAIAAMYYTGWNVESYVDHWYQRETYLKAYEKYIQPMTNINMWPRSTRPLIEPPEITPMPGKPDFSSSCGSQPSVQANTSTASAAAERDANASTAEEMPVNAKSSNRRPAGRPSNAQSAPTCSGRPANAHSAPIVAGRHANVASVGGVRPARASTADIRPAAVVMPTTTSAVDEPMLAPDGPAGLLTKSEVIDSERMSVDGREPVNLGKEREDVNISGERDFYRVDKANVEYVNIESDEVDVKDVNLEDVNIKDRSFEDIEKEKANKHAGQLGRNEEYLDSSDCWSEDGEKGLDLDIVRGVDLPRRRRSKKVRYDENCKLVVDSSDFIVKNYHPIHKCIPLNKNKMCDSKLIARKYKDRIVSQLYDWFIRCLIADLNLRSGEGLTVMSDQQKNLVPVLMELLSNAERRMRTRYIWSNCCCAKITSKKVSIGAGRGQGDTDRGGAYRGNMGLIKVNVVLVVEVREKLIEVNVVLIGEELVEPDKSSERVHYGGTNLTSATPINIDIDFKPRGLKCHYFSPNRYCLCTTTEYSIKIWDLESKSIVVDLKMDLKQESEMSAATATAVIF
ncbi:hypothetical protein BC332_07099 [Capsicum chinense]|nr:hypothetical protein BC332_07099 [Capsicum chinense]